MRTQRVYEQKSEIQHYYETNVYIQSVNQKLDLETSISALRMHFQDKSMNDGRDAFR